jgi:hypothetical protein
MKAPVIDTFSCPDMVSLFKCVHSEVLYISLEKKVRLVYWISYLLQEGWRTRELFLYAAKI